MQLERQDVRWRAMFRLGWPFALLCVLDSTRWLLEGAVPCTAPTVWSQAIGSFLAAGAFGLLGLRATERGVNRRPRFRPFGRAVAGGCLLAAPALAARLAGRTLSSSASVLALALVPVVVAVAGSVGGERASEDLPGELWPGLAGVAGLLLLLPEPAFSGVRPWGGLVVLPLLTGLGASGCLRGQAGAVPGGPGGRWRDASLACGLGGVLLGALAIPGVAGGEAARFPVCAAGLDAMTAALTLFSLLRLGSQRWSALYLLVPLLTLLQGLVFLRPFVDLRSWIGLGLLGAGAARLLWARPGDGEGGSPLDLGRRVPPA